jgi:hypothetical protein
MEAWVEGFGLDVRNNQTCDRNNTRLYVHSNDSKNIDSFIQKTEAFFLAQDSKQPSQADVRGCGAALYCWSTISIKRGYHESLAAGDLHCRVVVYSGRYFASVIPHDER